MHANPRYPHASGQPRTCDPHTAARHFGDGHPLARLARERCQSVGHRRSWRGACGRCWEQVVRDDERFVVECGLPRAFVPDPLYVDEIAVDRACAGEEVSLTRVELAAAVGRLWARGLCCGQIAHRLGRDYRIVRRVLNRMSTSGVAA